MNKPACYAPWVTTYEKPSGINPCCAYQPNTPSNVLMLAKHETTLEERFNHPYMVKLKDHLLNSDKLPSACIGCEVDENYGVRSLREQLDDMVADNNYAWDVNKFEMLWLDHRASNECNFSCKMCGSDFSNVHAKINGQYGKTGIIKSPNDIQMYLDQLDTIKQVNLLGGEPMLMDSTFTILKEIRKRNLQSQIDLSIVTNGSLLHRKKDDLIKLLAGFKFVDIAVSMDVMGAQHNYWRQKNTWDAVETNIKILYEWAQENRQNKQCALRVALSWPTAFAAREVFDKFSDMNIDIRWNQVIIPSGLGLNCLPQLTLDRLVKHWKDYPDVQYMFKETITAKNADQLLINGKKDILRQDRYHNTDFVTAFPEYTEFYNQIQVDKH